MKKFIKEYIPFILLTVAMLLFHLLLQTNWGDDEYHRQKTSLTLWEIASSAFNRWSSRVILHIFGYYFVKLPPIIWKIVNTAIISGIAVVLSKLFANKNSDKALLNWIIVGLLCLYPWKDMSSAGWISTTTNYLWPLFFLLVALLPIKKLEQSQSFRIWEYPIYALSALIGGNQEQAAASLFGIYLVYSIYAIVKRRSLTVIILQLSMSIFNILWILFCPGNYSRGNTELQWFSDFKMLGFSQKLDIGLSRTLNHMFYTANFFVLIICLVLVVLVYSGNYTRLHWIVTLVPLVTILIFSYFYPFFQGFYVFLTKIKSQFVPYSGLRSVSASHGVINFTNFTSPYAYICFFILCFALVCMVLSITIVIGDAAKGFFIGYILLLSVAVTTAMGLSPTVWASSTRTFLFMYMGLIACSLALFQELYTRKLAKKAKYIRYSYSLLQHLTSLIPF